MVKIILYQVDLLCEQFRENDVWMLAIVCEYNPLAWLLHSWKQGAFVRVISEHLMCTKHVRIKIILPAAIAAPRIEATEHASSPTFDSTFQGGLPASEARPDCLREREAQVRASPLGARVPTGRAT